MHSFVMPPINIQASPRPFHTSDPWQELAHDDKLFLFSERTITLKESIPPFATVLQCHTGEITRRTWRFFRQKPTEMELNGIQL